LKKKSNKMENKAINFEFTSYEFKPENGRVIFNYKTEFKDKEPIIWKEELILPQNIPAEIIESYKNQSNEKYNQINKILQSLHIILGISYYKFYPVANISFGPTVRTIGLSKNEAEFWNVVYKKGLGEFIYRNKLDFKKLPKFPYDNVIHNLIGDSELGIQSLDSLSVAGQATFRENNILTSKSYLVGVGGGKDSIVGIELLKESKENLLAFYVQTSIQSKNNLQSGLVDEVIKLTGLNEFRLQRVLDTKVLDNHQYNGHIPISAIYAFLGIFTSIIYNYKGFIVSNEYSSNFGNVKYKGQDINHQWSKTFEFENLFNKYIKENISNNLEYFSILRPFYEIKIAEMFTRYSKYFYIFSSCNQNFKSSESSKVKWCGKCAKCVFTFILLSAFLPKKQLINIFKNNLYKEENLLNLFKDILGIGKLKPFDCVGTFNEAQTAFKLAQVKYKNDFIMRQLEKKLNIDSSIFKIQKENLVPEKLIFTIFKKVLIIGYGKEGIASKKYLQKFFPHLKIGIADSKQGRGYLDKQLNYDIAIKTPGIKKELISIPYTTATNIFLSNVVDDNIVIGVTGSKGKSTTASLIYQILKDNNKDVELLGNIGKPMLEYLLEKPFDSAQGRPQNKIFVLELSSYQLDDIKFSPHIAVVTNLFPEHLDYHNNLNNYYNAKKNIIKFQNKNNYFVYNKNNKLLDKWVKDYNGNAVKFENSNLKSNLLGEHNSSNIGASVAVAKILNISEELCAKSIENFKSLPHRLEYIGQYNNINFYDDAISTTPDSTIMAIQALCKIGKITTIFLGGQDRGYDFRKLEKILKKHNIKNIVLFPDSGNKILKSRKGFNILETKSMKQAVDFAYKNTGNNEICLLSCASPSYSVWKNFEEKGDLFKKFVILLSKNEK